MKSYSPENAPGTAGGVAVVEWVVTTTVVSAVSPPSRVLFDEAVMVAASSPEG